MLSRVEFHGPHAAPRTGARTSELGERIRRLQRQAEALAVAEIAGFRETLSTAVRQAEEIADGGEVFPVGVREQARRLAEDLRIAALNLQALAERRYGRDG